MNLQAKQLIPFHFRALLKYILKRGIFYSRSFPITNDSSGSITICYAGMRPLEIEKSSGGRKKLELLANHFNENNKCFNILYLVSSALPLNVEDWIFNARKKKIKIVLNQNGVGYPAWAGKKYKSHNRLRRYVLKNADYVIYQSLYAKNSSDKFLTKRNSNYEILFNAVDTVYFTPKVYIEKTGNKLNLLVAGSHSQKERIFIPLHVLKILHERNEDASLTIAGRMMWPDALHEIQSYISSHQLDSFVKIIHSYSSDNALHFFQNADLLLHLQYKDVCPTVVLEAMACCVPVISSKSGGTPELTGEDTGFSFQVENSWTTMHYPEATAIADKIAALKPVLQSMKKKARERAVSMFDIKQWVQKHEVLFRKLICLF